MVRRTQFDHVVQSRSPNTVAKAAHQFDPRKARETAQRQHRGSYEKCRPNDVGDRLKCSTARRVRRSGKMFEMSFSFDHFLLSQPSLNR